MIAAVTFIKSLTAAHSPSPTHELVSNSKPQPARPRIIAINLVRVITVAAVIVTHIAATGPLYGSPTSGVVWMLSHTSRNLFILISALVLMYNYGDRAMFKIGAFYRKRFTLIFIPYAVWSLIYQLRFSGWHESLFSILSTFGYNLLTAKAMYHLYFLLITMQIYLLFPLIRYVYHKIKQRPWLILSISFVLQLVITAVMQYGPHPHGLGWWLNSPDNYIMSYQLYIVMGMIIASHVGKFEHLVLRYRKHIYLITPLVSVVGLLWYFVQMYFKVSIVQASAVFQPYLVLESTMFILAVFALSFHWSQKGAPYGRIAASIADDSFGIYLAHLFVISYISFLQPVANGWLTVTLTLLIGVPVVYGLSFGLTEIVRHTQLSLFLTGRQMARGRSRSQPVISKATIA